LEFVNKGQTEKGIREGRAAADDVLVFTTPLHGLYAGGTTTTTITVTTSLTRLGCNPTSTSSHVFIYSPLLFLRIYAFSFSLP
jgi:hypothetical protein